MLSKKGQLITITAGLLSGWSLLASGETTDGLPLLGCVNVGGGEYLATDGKTYAADFSFSGGNSASSSFQIENTEDDELFNSERWGLFSYDYPLPSSGAYTVELMFAEVFFGPVLWADTGARVFDVVVEGQTVAANYDINADVGPLVADSHIAAVTSSDNLLNISFNPIVDYPKFSAFCVYQGIASVDSDGDGTVDSEDAFPADPNEQTDDDGDGVGNNADAFPQDANESSDLDGDGIGDNSDSDRDGDGVDNTNDAFPNDSSESQDTDGDGIGDNSDPNVNNPNANLLMCINAGGPAYQAQNGRQYAADNYFYGGSDAAYAHQISQTEDDFIYNSERWGQFSYEIPVLTSGIHTLQLEFAETFYAAVLQDGGPGYRVFDVLAEGNTLLPSYDPLALAPSKTALTEYLSFEVVDGAVNLDFNPIADWPKLSGFCLYSGVKKPDLDDDGYADDVDAFPEDPSEWLDTDGDGVGDNSDAFINDASEWADLDGDGIGDNSDADRDGDGVNNEDDALPNDPSDFADSDGDGIGDAQDTNELPDYSLVSCINAGGDEYIAANGTVFAADSHFSGGSTGTTTLEIDQTIDDPLFQTERWEFFSYHLPVTPGKRYTVELYFTEMFYRAKFNAGGVGSRVFDVLVEDQVAVDNFDIYAQNNAPLVALSQLITRDATDDSLDISFDQVADYPQLSALCLYEGLKLPDFDGDGVPDELDAFPHDPFETQDSDGDGIGDNADAFPNDPSESADLDNDGIGNNSDNDRDGDGTLNADDLFPNDPSEWADTDGDGFGDNSDEDPLNPNNELVACVNVGGPSYTTAGGIEYTADQYFSGGESASVEFAINETLDDALYQTERWGAFSYAFPVTSERVVPYTVEMKFAETFYQASIPTGGVGSRSMDIRIEGELVEDNLDLLALAPANTAINRTYFTHSGDSSIDIDFVAQTDWPTVSAICLYRGIKPVDSDSDGVADHLDAFPADPAEWADSDLDGVGDNADAFPNDPNETSDIDGDGIGDGQDNDRDGDGFDNNNDAFPNDPTEWVDTDGDTLGDNSDPDPLVAAPLLEFCLNSGGGELVLNGRTYQQDLYFVGGNASSTDLVVAGTDIPEVHTTQRWGDFSYSLPVQAGGIYTIELYFAEALWGVTQMPAAGQRLFDLFIEDRPYLSNFDLNAFAPPGTEIVKTFVFPTSDNQLDIRFQQVADFGNVSAVCLYRGAGGPDQDGDGVPNEYDMLPLDPNDALDADFDGVGDNSDAFPWDASEQADSDGDGVGDNADAFPNDPNETTDLDSDGIGDNSDSDRDGDGVDNGSDAFPDDARVAYDSDGDGVGDELDADPYDPAVQVYAPDFNVTFVQATAPITSLALADAALSNNSLSSSTGNFANINFFNGTDLTGANAGSVDFPYADPMALRAERDFYVDQSATYTFLVQTDGGVRLSIDGVTLIEDGAAQPFDELYATISLSSGLHHVELVYFQGPGQSSLELMAAKGDHFEIYSQPWHYDLLSDRVSATLEPWDVLEPHVGGTWGPVLAWPEIAVSAVQMPDGRFLTWNGGNANWFAGLGTIASVWDPESGTFLSRNHPDHNMFCSGISLLENGNVVTTGGNNTVTKTSMFDIHDLQWSFLSPMNFPRWYPTQMTLPDNDLFVTFAMGAGDTSERFDEDDQAWVYTTGATQQGQLNDQGLINENPIGNESTDMQWYSFMHVAPDGRIFQSGPTETMHWFTAKGLGSVEPIGARIGGDQARMFGSAIMYDVGKILITGGNDLTQVLSSSDTAIIADLNGPSPVVRQIDPMHYRRTFHNSVVLPDGEVFVVGGTTDGILFSDEGTLLQPEMFNPETEKWRFLSSHGIPRNYHSVALLMKDARVFSAGGGSCNGCAADHQDAQIYTPPYLYNENGSLADRPSISSAPAQAKAGDSVSLQADPGIARFSMIRLQGLTHSINTDQRFMDVEFTANGGDYSLSMNANPNVLIPGYYWIFALNADGVPSEGRTIQILRDANALDSDGDGIPDSEDAFPNDPAEGTDQDNDGVGDNADAFPTDPSEWADSDFDGVGDNSDVFPNNSQESIDSDGDGYGDNGDDFPNDAAAFTTAAQAPYQSSTILVEPNTGRVWNVNTDNNSVSASTANLASHVEINVGEHPAALAITQDGSRIIVTNKGSASLSVISTTTLAVVDTISLPSHSQPHGIVANGNNTVFVVLEGLGTLAQVSLSSGSVTSTLDTDLRLRHLSISHDGSELLVPTYITPQMSGEFTSQVDVSVGGGRLMRVSTNTLAVSDTITLAYANRGVSDVAGPGIPNYISAPAVSANQNFAYVPSKQDNIMAGELRGGAGMNFDQTVRAVTSIVNLQSGTENPGARVHHDNSSIAAAAVISGNGEFLFVALETSREVAIYNIASSSEIARIDTAGIAPQGLALSANGTQLYIHNFMSRSITQVDISQLLYTRLPSYSVVGTQGVVDVDALSADVLLGKQLFYDAADDRLARDNYMSCAACHSEGGDDGRVWDLSAFGEGLRNTISLIGKGSGHGLLHWSGNFDEVQDFEGQIRSLAGGSGLMTDTSFNVSEYSLGTAKAGYSSDLDALAAYVESLTTPESSPYRPIAGLSSEAVDGQQLFAEHNCASCHSGSVTTDSATGVRHNVGTISLDSGERLGGFLDGIDTPSLFGLWNTAPYLHDGSAETIKDAIEAHSGLLLAPGDSDKLEAFLKEIDVSDI